MRNTYKWLDSYHRYSKYSHCYYYFVVVGVDGDVDVVAKLQ